MRGRDELCQRHVDIKGWSKTGMMLTEEDGRIDWEVTAHTDTPHGGKRTEGNVTRRGSGSGGEDSNDKQGGIEGPPGGKR